MKSPTRPSLTVSTIVDDTAFARTLPQLAQLLRRLHRRDARQRGTKARTYRELAAKTGWSHAMIAAYLRGTTLPPTDRFDELIALLGATPAERAHLARARDRVDELRRTCRDPGASPSPAGRGVIPHELPARVSGFVGRASALDSLDSLSRTDAGSLVVAAICGGGGVGKTALALHWAHQACDRFPDGQLYVDLCGYAATEPLDAGEALGRILHTLGVAPHQLPADPADRATHYRSILSGRRMLVVLDNAASADQVRPLLPGSSTCMVLVTSRSSLGGLVAADGAQRIRLDVLTDAESWALLRTLLGERVYAAVEDVHALMALCGRLPLALRIAAELAQPHASASIAELVDELRDHTARLDLLDAGDTRSAVRPVLSWSYHRLSAPAATLFRLLGCEYGPDLSLPAVASLAGAAPADARRALAELARTHMVTEVAAGRFAMHHMLRAYAAERLGDTDPDELRGAVSRLVDHYAHTATLAARVLDPRTTPLGAVADDVTASPIESAADAHAWFAAERLTLPAVARLAREHDLHEPARVLLSHVAVHPSPHARAVGGTVALTTRTPDASWSSR